MTSKIQNWAVDPPTTTTRPQLLTFTQLCFHSPLETSLPLRGLRGAGELHCCGWGPGPPLLLGFLLHIKDPEPGV